MREEDKTREELLFELDELRHQIEQLKTIISSHNETERALRESEDRFHQLADATFEGVVIHENGGFLDFNHMIPQMFGYTHDEVIGKKNIFEFIALESRDIVLHHMETGYEKPYAVTMITKDGATLLTEVAGKTIPFRGRTARVVAIRDITDRKSTEEKIKKSEARFRNLIENIPIGVFIYEGTKFRYLNPACEKITGYTRSELYLYDIWELAHPEFQDTVKDYLVRRQRNEPVPELYEYKIVTKRGEERWVERNAIEIELEGKPVVLVTITDITERRRAEEVLRRSEEKYRSVLEKASDAIIIADCEGYFVEVNRRACELLGYTEEELIGKHYTNFHPTREHERTIDAFNTMVTHGYGVLQDGQIICKNGDILYTDITGSLIEYGGAKYIQGSFRDVSEKVYLQKALKKAVMERTSELNEKNIQLEKEIKERVHSEALLKENTKKLNRYTTKLEDFNVALKVLLTERENERADLEEKILMNIKYHMSPHLEKLKKRIQKKDNKALLENIQASLKNITSSFSQRLSSKNLHLTPSEIKIANMIRDGRTTKEIAGYMGVSTNAINHHRYHIRKKLGIASQKISLRAHLLSIPN